MRAEELLNEIEPLAYRDRCLRLAGLRRLSGEPELARLLDELAGRGHYERSLALFVAAAVRDEASLGHIARAMGDRDAEIASGAIGLAAKFGIGAGPFTEGLDDAPAAVRAATYQAIRRWRRADLAEALIDRVAARWGEAEAAALLPACGEETARDRIDGLAHALPNWRSFARSHPGVTLDFAERDLAGLPEGALRFWWWRHGPGVAATVRYAPGRVVGLLERYWRSGPLPIALTTKVGWLFDAEPRRMLALLLAEEHRSNLGGLLSRRAFRERLTRLGDGDLAAVARGVREVGSGGVMSSEPALRLLLKAFPPSRRERVFEAAMSGVDLGTAPLGDGLLDVLPNAMRAREARRMLGLRQVTESPSMTWHVSAFLPYDEAHPVLTDLTRRPDANERATGYRLLIQCAGRTRDPEVLTRLLGSLDRLRNDQDPVRMTALAALAAIPPSVLRAEHAPLIAQLTDDALSARDRSNGTIHALTRLAVQVARQGAIRGDAELLVLAFEVFGRLTGHTRFLSLGGRLEDALRRGQEHDLVRALSPHLASAARRDDHTLALTHAEALGRRAYDVPELQDALEAALDARDDGVIRKAIGLWLAPPRTRTERVARVVAKEPSAVAVPAVFGAIASERTDLLHLVLSGRTAAGRFRRPDVTYVPIADSFSPLRWTARQRADYLALLHKLAGDVGVSVWERAKAINAIGRVPGAGPEELRRYLDPELRPYFEGDDVLLFRTALTVAPWLSSPQDVLADLLALASTDNAHVAVYAAGRAARFVPPSALAGALAPALTTGKVTARKEALRILLRNRVPQAMDLIAAAWDDPGQHRDVRAAIASAVRGHLGEPVAQRILTEATEGPRDLARQVLGTPPLLVEERFRAYYAGLVLRVARSDDPEARDAALTVVSSWAPWAPEAPALLAALVTDLTGTGGWRYALDGLVTCATTGSGTAELTSVATALATAPAQPDADAERDLPALQRLITLVSVVRQRAQADRNAVEPALRALDGHLPEPQASELIAATLRWDAPGVADALDALADRPIGGALAIEHVAEALAGDSDEDDYWDDEPSGLPDPEEVQPHAARLAARADLTGGLFACALTGRHGPRAGWPEEWRDLLRRLRSHPHADVAYTARSVLTADE